MYYVFSPKPVNRFDSLSCINGSIWLYMILSKSFDSLNKTLTGLYFSLSRSSFFLKLGLTSESFKSPGKHLFSNDKLMTLVVSERCVSSVNCSIFAGKPPKGVALELSIHEITCRTCSSITCWKENLLLIS